MVQILSRFLTMDSLASLSCRCDSQSHQRRRDWRQLSCTKLIQIISYKMIDNLSNKSEINQRRETTQDDCEDELHFFGQQLSENAHNVLSFKRAKKNRVKTLEHLQPTLPFNEFSLLSSEQADSQNSPRGKSKEFFQLFTQNKNKIIQKQIISKRKSAEKQQPVSLEKIKKRPKSVVAKEKPLPRGDKFLMVWLNKALADYCLEDAIEEGRLKALQKFGLDKNALLARGINLYDIQKLYETLFAHSMGFNSRVKELISNQHTMKSIWKVYAILLEYCSQGHFQTIIGELERDMQKKEERLLDEIQKRQKMIDNTDERMEEKLFKFQRQNRELHKTLSELDEKYRQMENDYHEIEMAFNMEVTLRLNYEHKINRVYSIHERLNMIHLNLFKDFEATGVAHKKAAEQATKSKAKNIELGVNYKEAINEVQELKKAITGNELTIQGLRMNEKQLEERIAEQVRNKRYEVMDMREKDKRIYHLEQEIISTNTVIEIMKTTASTQLQQYRHLSEENLDLRMLKHKHIERIGELLTQNNHISGRQSSIKSELQFFRKKSQKLERELAHSKAQNVRSIRRAEDAEVDKKAMEMEMKQLNKVIQLLKKGLQQNKELYERFKEKTEESSKYSSSLRIEFDKILDDKMEYELKIKTLQDEKFETELELNRAQGEISKFKKQSQLQSQNQSKKYQKLHQIWSKNQTMSASLEEELQKTKNELEVATARISLLSQQYTDQSFEKAKLETIYENNLVLHDREKNAQKELLIQISTYNQNLSDLQREFSLQEKNHAKKIFLWKKEKEKLQSVIETQNAKIKSKEGFVHPMLLQDALQNLQREQDLHKKSKNLLSQQLEKEKDKNSLQKTTMRKMDAEHRTIVRQLEHKLQKTQYNLKREIQYFKDQFNDLRSTNYDLELKMAFHKQQMQSEEQLETQHKMSKLIQEKSLQIEQLMQQLTKTQDRLMKKEEHFVQEIKNIKQETKVAIQALEESKKQLEQKIVQIQQQYEIKLEQQRNQSPQLLPKEKTARVQTEQKVTSLSKGKLKRKISQNHSKRAQFSSKLRLATKRFQK